MTSEESIVADALVESLRALHRDDPAPVYVQIERRIRMGVADGTLQPGDHLPSVRDLARQLGLSPNTVGRAYAELSREGVIMARAGGGSEIAARDRLNQPALLRTRLERLRVLARQMAVRGLALGLEPDEIAEAVRSELAAHGRPISGMPIQDSLGEHEAPKTDWAVGEEFSTADGQRFAIVGIVPSVDEAVEFVATWTVEPA